MAFSGKTVDNLFSESLCIPCNSLRRAEFEDGFTGWIGQMRQSKAEQEMGRRESGRGNLESLPPFGIEGKTWLC